MKADFAVILAAGDGKRMNSSSPAALKRVCGLSLVEWSIRAVLPCCENPPVVVQGSGREIERALGGIARFATQENPVGTADALRRALAQAPGFSGLVLVAHANLPLLQSEYYQALVEAASREGAATIVYSDESCDCVVSAGAWCFADWAIKKVLDTCCGCASVEELIDALSEMGVCVQALLAEPCNCAAAVDRASLALCEGVMNARILDTHLRNGVTIIDPASVRIGPDVVIGRDAEIGPSVILSGKTEIGEDSVIKNGCTLNDTKIGRTCELHYVVANETAVGNGVKIGPFVNLRPGTVIADDCKVGDFVEVKNSNIGRGTKLPHLSYIGDADVGARVNVGCGCVFVNYDGFRKHRTTVGNDVFLGCQTNLVAPVTVGDDAYTAAGSTINRDVPAGAMAFARTRQENKEGYVERFRSLKRKD